MSIYDVLIMRERYEIARVGMEGTQGLCALISKSTRRSHIVNTSTHLCATARVLYVYVHTSTGQWYAGMCQALVRAAGTLRND